MDDRPLLRQESDHRIFSDLYRSAGLEVEEGWETDMNPVFSVAAERDSALLGAATLSYRLDRWILDYIAVESDRRGGGIGKMLTEACLEYAKSKAAAAVWLSARTPGFFRALGAVETGGTELLAECIGCPDFQHSCTPLEMIFDLGDD